MKVYLVLAYDQYYPKADNVKGVFASEGGAEGFMTTLRKTRDWEYYRIVEKEMLT
jgi:hypothetical protein